MENGFEISLQCSALYGYQFLRAAVPLVERISLLVGEDAPEGKGELELSYEPRVFPSWRKKLGELRKGERILVPPMGDGLAEALLGNYGPAVEVTCALKGEGGILAQSRVRVPICDFCEYCGADSYLSLTASFVTPEALAVRRLADRLPQKRSGGGGRYGKEEILRLIQEIYALLQRGELTYSIHSFSAERKGERLRLPAQCLREQNANAAELAFVFASLAEAAGLDAMLIWHSSSVTVGIFTGVRPSSCSEIFDPVLLQQYLREGILTVLDPSGVCYGTNVPLAISEKSAREAIENPEDFLGAVDVSAAREEGVRGIPSELYESVSEEYVGRLLPAEEQREKESVVAAAKRSLMRSPKAWALLRQRAVALSMDAQEAQACICVSAEEELREQRACLGVGRVEYEDPLYADSSCAYVLLYPLQQKDDGSFEKTDAPILNTLLLERLSVLYGLYAAPVQEAFSKEGYDGVAREMGEYLAGKKGVSFFGDACALGSFDPYPCLSYDGLCRFSYSPGVFAPQWDERGLPPMDRDAWEALETAKSHPLSLILSPENQLREELVLALAARGMAAGRQVKLISPRGEEIRLRLEENAARALENPSEKPKKTSYFDELFFVHSHGYSFYQAHLLWDKYSHAPEAARIPPVLSEGMKPEDVVGWSKAVSELIEACQSAGGVKDNPLRGIENPYYSEEHKERAALVCDRLCSSLEQYLSVLEQLRESFSLEGEITMGWARRMEELLQRLQEARLVPYYYYEQRDDRLAALVETGKNHAALRACLEERFYPSVFRLDAEALQSELRDERGFSVLRGKSPRRSAVQALRSCARSRSAVNENNAGEIAEQLLRCREYTSYLCANSAELKRCFGVDVQSPDEDPSTLWAKLGDLCQKGEAVWEAYRRMEGADESKLSRLCKSEELSSRLARLSQELCSSDRERQKAEEELRDMLSLGESMEESLQKRLEAAKAMRQKMDTLREWSLWLRARASALSLGLAGVVEQCESGRFGAEELKLNFLCGFFRCVADQIRSHSPALEAFDPCREQEQMEDLYRYGREEFDRLCRAAVERGSLQTLGLREASRAAVEENVSLLIVDGAEKISAKEGTAILSKGEQTVVVASPLKECEGSSLAQMALRLGAKEKRLSLSYEDEPEFSRLAQEFAADCGESICASAYPVLSPDCRAELVRVNGGYDEKTATNVIEASVIVDELLAGLESSEDSVTVVCFGEAQRKLVTLLLAKRLAALPELTARYLADPTRFVVCALGEEAPKADRVLVSLCFSCPHGKYGEGLSGKLSAALGENPGAHLTKLFFLAKKRLCFTVAFTMEEVAHTRRATEQIRCFARFAAEIFSLPRLSRDTREESLPCEGVVESLARALEEKGYPCRKNAGYSCVGVPLLVEDPREKGRVAVAVIADDTLRSLCSDPALAAPYLEGFARRGVRVYRLSALAWYCDKEAVIKKLLDQLEEQLGQADSLMREMTSMKTE